MNKKSMYSLILFGVILSSLIFIMGSDRKNYEGSPIIVYQVYLEGKQIGVIEDENELYELIDKDQESLKKEYGVSNVYAPNELTTTKILTYSTKVDNVNDVYNVIKENSSFTIKGYEVSIVHSEDNIEVINILNKEDFDKSIENTIKSFVDDEQYENYLNGVTSISTKTGSIINNVDIKEEIIIKEKYLSTNEKIYTNTDDLSKYLLFGTDEVQGTHIVIAGETLDEIANDYELSTKELLIVNPDIKSEKSLLFSGQEINVGLVKPIISIVVDSTLVEDKEVTYSKETKYDEKLVVGTKYTEQQGQNGVSRVTYETESINGSLVSVIPTNTEVLTPVVNEVIVMGGLSKNYVGDTGKWYWPTNKPYIITCYYAWRTHPIYFYREFHYGIDISGTGYGSPIYAAQTGTITQIGYDSGMGYYMYINHGNGYETIYMHFSKFVSGIAKGTVVTKGEQIGYMGSTGNSTGPHLDFRIKYNGNYLNPLNQEYD